MQSVHVPTATNILSSNQEGVNRKTDHTMPKIEKSSTGRQSATHETKDREIRTSVKIGVELNQHRLYTIKHINACNVTNERSVRLFKSYDSY